MDLSLCVEIATNKVIAYDYECQDKTTIADSLSDLFDRLLPKYVQ